MKRFELIVVDMDGVLSNFRKGVSELFDIDIDELDDWDLYKKIGLEAGPFWETIASSEEFWYNLEKFPHADDLMKMLEKYTEEIIICSHPPRDHGSYGMKKRWLDKHNLGKYRHFVGNADKGWLACENRLLVDDYVKNILSFRERGGLGIIFPQEYSIRYIEDLNEVPNDRVTYVESKLKYLLGLNQN